MNAFECLRFLISSGYKFNMDWLHKKGGLIVPHIMIDLVDNQSAAPLLALLYSMTSIWVAISAEIIVSLHC